MAGEVWRHGRVHMSQMKALEGENRRLKRIFADLSMLANLLREALGKK
ncbi:Mobile element protein [Rhodobacter sp. AKP1]|nr:Transposase IS3/IS911 family protein [Cereibacter sphaeroides KD131]EKX56090.1 Mobile element protein [Rhodobacter sp. AKP1]